MASPHPRPLRNLPPLEQQVLRRAFPWLQAVMQGEHPAGVQMQSVSVFDHWLSADEAQALLTRVPAQEQARRDGLHARFGQRLLGASPALPFVFRTRTGRRTVFRAFTDPALALAHCTPPSHTSRRRPFQVVLPALGCAFVQGWDDTHHLFFSDAKALPQLAAWAAEVGLFLLPGS